MANEANEDDTMQIEEVTFMMNEGQQSTSSNNHVTMKGNDDPVIIYDWLADTAATSHIFNQNKAFVNYTLLTGKTVVGLSNNHARARNSRA
jgi:hypothetical protein